jgi:large subunit ribosomal protein L13
VKTHHPDVKEIDKNWYLVDAEGQVLGRLASRIASILRGKDKPYFAPNVDVGDFVVVVNAEKVAVTGNKAEAKEYFTHSGYPGGAKSVKLSEMLSKKPEHVIRHAVGGMLPKNSLGRQMLKKLKVYSGPSHPHKAQEPAGING